MEAVCKYIVSASTKSITVEYNKLQ